MLKDSVGSAETISGGGRGGRNKKQLRNKDGQFASFDMGMGKGNRNKKDGPGGKGLSCGWINFTNHEMSNDNDEKLKRVKAVYAWYDTFVRGIPKDLISKLSSDPINKYVAWEVQSVISQLKNVYSRAEDYLKTAETEKSRLDSMMPPPNLSDANNGMIFSENNPIIEQLFRLDKLKYSNTYLLSILSGINNEKLRAFAERWIQKEPQYRTQRVTQHFVGLQYDPMYDVFFAHYGYDGFVSPPVVSVRFTLSIKNGTINERDDCHGYVYEKVQSDVRHLITIVSPISTGDNLWSLFKNRPLTYRRPRSTRSNKNSINDPFSPSYGGVSAATSGENGTTGTTGTAEGAKKPRKPRAPKPKASSTK